MIQTLNRKGSVHDLVADYGHILVDECHHVSAFSFEQVLRQAKGRFIVGFTATPSRKDGHHPIIFMQCGPIRFALSARKMASMREFEHKVVVRHTNVEVQESEQDLSIHVLYRTLVEDQERNDLILSDIERALRKGRSPIVLTERRAHLEYLAERLLLLTENLIVFHGGMSERERRIATEKLGAIHDGEERLLLATGRYIGEGFDDSRLDTLFLTMPISWRGTLHQYAGRLHRSHDAKQEVVIYDYVDSKIPMAKSMFDRRKRGYTSIGYYLEDSSLLNS
jgi:superfamily II DNA or RNA helicase